MQQIHQKKKQSHELERELSELSYEIKEIPERTTDTLNITFI